MSIWNEKPDFRQNQYWSGIIFNYQKFNLVKWEQDEKAWLEKLMQQQLEDKQILIDRINELEPKAEKWDHACGIIFQHKSRRTGYDTATADELIEDAWHIARDEFNAQNKLEDVRTWLQAQLGNEVDPQDLTELHEILEAKK